jgi:hypothetical protein
LVGFNSSNPPQSLGSTFKTKEQLRFLVSNGFSSIQSISPIKTFKLNNRIFNEVGNVLFFNQ